jgi:glycosyltransferase involved in cell wall biosynthesis
LRILLVIEPSGGGSGRHVIDLAGALIQRGHDVSLIYSPTRAEPQFQTEAAALPLRALQRLPMRRAVGPWDLPALARLRRLIRALGPFEIVHGHSAKAGALVRLAAPPGAGRVYTPHALPSLARGNPLRFGHGLVEALLARAASEAVIAVSPDEAAHAVRWGLPAAHLHTVLNGVAPCTPRDRKRTRTDLDLADDAVAVGFVGRLCTQKDPVRFAAAVRQAASRNRRIVGVVIGEGDLSAQVRAAGGQAVRLLGAREARPLLPALDLLVMTSRYEAMPYSLIEAASAGLPILATEVGGVSTALNSGAPGQSLPTNVSPEGIADAILDWTERPRPHPSSHIAECFSLDRMADATVAVYRQAFAKRRLARV